jgi:D-alanyl-D-alanine carboxypeptidase
MLLAWRPLDAETTPTPDWVKREYEGRIATYARAIQQEARAEAEGEVERLREALERIEVQSCLPPQPHGRSYPDEVVLRRVNNMARRYLLAPTESEQDGER